MEQQEQAVETVETEVYEPPALVAAGDFTDVTNGPWVGLRLDSVTFYR